MCVCVCVCVGLGPRRSSSAQPSGSSSSSRYNNQQTSTGSTPTPTSGSQVEVGGTDTRSQGSLDVGGSESENGVSHGSSGSAAVDKALMQHLIHCESLLVVSDPSRGGSGRGLFQPWVYLY